MKPLKSTGAAGLSRRDFLQAIGGTTASISLSSGTLLGAGAVARASTGRKKAAIVRGAFIYPPTESLRQVGYYSWPGSTFDAEGRQAKYMKSIRQIERKLGIRIVMDEKPLDTADDTARFVAGIQQAETDGLLLIPFKKGHWGHVTRIVEETQIPTVVLATLGILLVGHVKQLHREPGVFLINSLDNLDAVEDGMKMIRTACRMKQSRIVNLRGAEPNETTVPHIGTTVRTLPRARFVDEFTRTDVTPAVKALAKSYMTDAEKVLEPTKADIVEAAKTYFALRRIIEAEKADAVMMDCLPGLRRPHTHVPPCMGYMSLRDEGVPAGCESDLDATLTLMLLQQLFDKPGFQHNPTVDTEKNHYFCAHCTSASKMKGSNAPAEPYVLMNHAEAGWGCVPRVLFTPGQDITIAKYLSVTGDSEERPQMLVYSGQVIGCPPVPQTGGCRTNAETTINELGDVCDLKGHHLCMIYGDCARRLRQFCRLYRIDAVT
ncbi:MAG: hypothetical protein JSU70_20080 [Phycisphaerales bacterium]|nr:MAG: hypothetical protein JSU70_20080 [Phycisphaerales bacterium]